MNPIDFQFRDRQGDPPLQLGDVRAGRHPEVPAGEVAEVHLDHRRVVEPLVEEAVHPLRRRQVQSEKPAQIELFRLPDARVLKNCGVQ
jgi:hypothetical protein